MYIIRADGNARIGAGHLMRCLTIADALAEQVGGKNKIRFVCADEQSGQMAKAAGYEVSVLQTDYRDMESELPCWDELRTSGEWLSGDEEHTILVDSYYVTDAYLKELQHYGKVYLMDDMQEHAYPVDGVINYNAFADEEVYARLYAGTETECLVGSAYVPIRQQFLHRNYEVADQVEHVLITTGGGDQDNIAGKLLETIYRETMNFHIVTGRFNPHLETLRTLENRLQGVRIYHDVSDMAGLMEKCDIAVTAGGTTIYELAAMGVPFLCFSYARNQEALTRYIGEKEIAGFLGAYHMDEKAVLEELRKYFDKYCESYDLRKRCFDRERKMIDGKGAKRIAAKLTTDWQ